MQETFSFSLREKIDQILKAFKRNHFWINPILCIYMHVNSLQEPILLYVELRDHMNSIQKKSGNLDNSAQNSGCILSSKAFDLPQPLSKSKFCGDRTFHIYASHL